MDQDKKKELFLKAKQVLDEKKQVILDKGKALEMMTSTDGWSVLREWMSEKIAKTSDLSIIDTSTDEKIIASYRAAQSRRDTYVGIINFVDAAVSNYKKQKENANG